MEVFDKLAAYYSGDYVELSQLADHLVIRDALAVRFSVLPKEIDNMEFEDVIRAQTIMNAQIEAKNNKTNIEEAWNL